MNKIVVFHVVWMDTYKCDIDTTGNATFGIPEEEGYGHELFNFQPIKGKNYGFVRTSSNANLNLKKLGASKNDISVDGVTVVWTAPHPEKGGRAVVGWYNNAKVFSENQPPTGIIRQERKIDNHISGGYRAVAEADDCVIIDPEDRKQFTHKGEGGKNGLPGQINIYYPQHGSEAERRLRVILNDHNKKVPPSTAGKKVKGKWQSDLEKRLKIEKVAVTFVCTHFTDKGYKIRSVEQERCGYDLEATKNGEILHIEVKGRSGLVIEANFTPNEYKSMQKFEKQKTSNTHYRICIVIDALNRPKLFQFAYMKEASKWQTFNLKHTLNFKKSVAATGSAI